MKKNNKEHAKRLKKVAMICTSIVVVLSAATYAWFIGMRTVNMSSFDVTIASTDSLLLSLDGENWSYEVSISKDTLDDVSYEDHTNSWGDPGLIPMSSVGEMDPNVSRMVLYEKSSFTATPGGYRIMSSRVKNDGAKETAGYVAFDLFVKNFTGKQYIVDYNPLDEEAIYLGVESEVTVAEDGLENTGIENSVRVAFTQVGRVSGGTKDVSVITGITCNDTEHVTGICKTAQIWEPNDAIHEQNAINWYNASCRARTGLLVREKSSYAGPCNPLSTTGSYPTYPISRKIESSDNVDVYDGPAYNGYTGSSSLLVPFNYFTDSDRDGTGVNRAEFMTLAPNSITKLRIYVYIEGQDIDNYEYAAIGKKISVNFGFTKERFNENDIDYDGPDLDQEGPILTLFGDNPLIISAGSPYVEPGYTAYDYFDGSVTSKVVVDSSDLDTNTVGVYIVKYTVTDETGNTTEEVRTVIVE